MPYDPNKHHRRSIRHPQHDYTTPGPYFVTVCTKWRACAFDDPALAAICIDTWRALPGWFPTIARDEFVIMSNHSHFIVWLGVDDPAPSDDRIHIGIHMEDRTVGDRIMGDRIVGDRIVGDRKGLPYGNDESIPWDWEIPTPQSQRLHPTLGNVVGAWKSLVSNTYLRWIKKHNLDRQAKFWQRNYYDRIIRNDRALEAVRRYIRENPIRWKFDPDNPTNALRLPYPETVNDYIDDIERYSHP
jgi:REP element-mobilizing transposase RayT